MRMWQVVLLAADIALMSAGDARAGARPPVRPAVRAKVKQRAVRRIRKPLVRRLLRRPPRARRVAGRLPSRAEARRFIRKVVARERRFYQPGVSYDAETGLTFDGHPIDRATGELAGAPRNWSAASK